MSREPQKRRTFQRRYEQLESRAMLAGHPLEFGPVAFGATAAAPAVNFQAIGSATANENFGGGFGGFAFFHHGGGGEGESSTSLTSALSDSSGDTATVTYQTGKLLGTQEAVFTVTGDTSAEGTTVTLEVGSTTIGTVSLDSSGDGTLIVPVSSLSTVPASGSAVSLVGTSTTLTGTFATATSTNARVNLSGSLSDSSGDTATLSYQTGKLLGVEEAVFKITGDTSSASSAVSIDVGSTTVGTVTLDASGDGTLIVPVASLAAVPTSGSAVSLVGTTTLTGTLATSTSTGGNGGGCQGGGSSSGTTLTSSISDSSGDTATVEYQTGKIGGVKDAVITVTGDTSAEGTSQTVTINSTSVGSISIDSSGNGTLIVPIASLGTTVASGNTVSVGGLSGTLASSLSSSSSSITYTTADLAAHSAVFSSFGRFGRR